MSVRATLTGWPRLLIFGVLAVAAVVIYGCFDPAVSPFPRCPLRWVTGFSCPGCGSQRATHALLHGDIASVVRYNALYLPAMAFVIVAVVARWRSRRLYARLTSATACYATLAVIIAWWVGRNIIGI